MAGPGPELSNAGLGLSAAHHAGAGTDVLPQALFLLTYTLTLLSVLSLLGSGPWTWPSQARALGPAPKAAALLLLVTAAGLPPLPTFYAKVGLLGSSLSTAAHLAPSLALGLGAG